MENLFGSKNITIYTEKETTEFALIFENISSNVQEKFTINKVFIQGQEFTLKYKYLPVNVVQKIENLFYPNKSVSERLTFFKDAIKIMGKSPILGLGGNAWTSCYPALQEYSYMADQIPSSPLKIGTETRNYRNTVCILQY